MLQTKYSANYSVNVNLVCLVKICIIWWLIWYTMSKHPHLHPIPPKHRKDAAPCLLWCKLLITTSTSQGLLFCQVVWGVYGVINGIREKHAKWAGWYQNTPNFQNVFYVSILINTVLTIYNYIIQNYHPSVFCLRTIKMVLIISIKQLGQ